ncbi:MAG: aminotransferase class III-fold pyridoxal phosphate-dependent enzyme [Pseudomonadota bacterium]
MKPALKNNHRYAQSEALLERAERSIPLGAQTFSKSYTQYPRGVSPYFITHGKGSHVWDADRHEYIDFVNSLAAITLGYCDPDVDAAVKKQMQNGTIFSLSHPIEMTVAEKMQTLIPGAERVRFGKNGSDATAGAIRLARAFTGKDHILACGYHGWQDWYIGSTTKNKGVPKSTQNLTHSFPFNDLHALEKLLNDKKGSVAAVIMEPMNITEPEEGYLQAVKELAHKHGAILIFDETVTGFRYDIGGAGKHFGVTADLSTFGKGMANGYPISAIVGRADIMKLMEEIFFSFTFGGETLSLAAALATMEKLEREPVIETLATQGDKIMTQTQALIDQYDLGETISLAGKSCWSFLMIKDFEEYDSMTIKTLFMQEMFENGILSLGSHNLSYAHSDEDIAKLMTAYNDFMKKLKMIFEQKSMDQHLKCEPNKPLFKVR